MPKIRSFSSFINTERIGYPRIIPEYGYDSVNHQVVVVGNKDVVSFVNASARDSLLKTKLQRYLAGDLLALGNGNAKGIYTDISGLPTDYNSIQATIRRVNDLLKENNCSDVPELLKSLSNKVKSHLDNLSGSSGDNNDDTGDDSNVDA